MAEIKSYRDLEVWQQPLTLAQMAYRNTASFPKTEAYGLVSQIRRAAVSVPSNIAEGHSRRTRQAFLNHLSITLGSQSELETQIEPAFRLGFLSQESAQKILDIAEQVGRRLHALIRSLEQKGA